MFEYHIKSKALATLAVRNRKTSRYFLFDKELTLCGWKNFDNNETIIVRNPSEKLYPLAFSGIHVINPKFINAIKIKGKFSITKAYINLAKNHLINAYKHNNSMWMDLGKPENIIEAEKYLNK